MTLHEYLNFPMPLWAYALTGFIACYAIMKWQDTEDRYNKLAAHHRKKRIQEVAHRYEADDLDAIIDRVKGNK